MLNSIIGITLEIIESYEEVNQLDNINLLADLSKYTTFLINDITQTLNKNLVETYKLNKVAINLKNILVFSFNILKALLKCYDEKYARVKPILEYDERINNFLIYSDEIRLKQIILNILSNSVKFTKRGFITIEAKVSGKNYEFIEILIKDSGVGIEPRKVKAFNEFEEKGDIYNNNANSCIFNSHLFNPNKSSKGSNSKSDSTIKNKFNSQNRLRGNPIDESNQILIRKKSENYNESNSIINPKSESNFKDNSVLNNEFGTGFGLIIAKRFAMRLGHKIELESVCGEYTILTIKLFPSEQLHNFNDNNESISTKKIDYIKTLSNRKIKNLLNISTINDNNYISNNANENKNMSFKELSCDENTFRDKNEINSNNHRSFLKSEEYTNSPISSEDYKISNDLSKTTRLDSKEKLEFKYKNFLKENINNITIESDIIDSDLTAKILNVKLSSRESLHLNSNRTILYKSSLNSTKSLFKIMNNPSSKENDISLIKTIKNESVYQTNNNKSINNNTKGLSTNPFSDSNATSFKSHLLTKTNGEKQDYKWLFAGNHNPKIILIDDQKYIRKSLANLLNLILKEKNLIYDIVEGADGIDLLNYIIEDNKNNNLIKMIITDENMEFINGTKAIELIRYLENENKIIKNNKIVITTSAEENKELYKFYEGIGANYILSKPCNQESLSIILENSQFI